MRTAIPFVAAAILLALSSTICAQQLPPASGKTAPGEEIALSEPLSLELPPGTTELPISDTALQGLLGAATSGGRRVTNDLTRPVRVGAVRITFTAWQGEPGKSAPGAVRSAMLYVLPAGTTPVGLSGDENATAGNGAPKIARDPGGRVHLVWLDSGRPGTTAHVYYRRATVSPNNTVVWETDPVRVDDAGAAEWNAYPSLAVAGNTVHVAWQGKQTAQYRRLEFTNGAWHWGPVRDTGAPSAGRDSGPAIAATNTGFIHIATPDPGYDAVSSDNGETWRAERIPLSAGRKPKTVSVTVDKSGSAHFALCVPIRGPQNPSQDRASQGYWELQYIRRSADGTWSVAVNPLAGLKEWAEPIGDDDVLADWPRILVDEANNLHLAWHGVASTRIYGRDHAYYMRRQASGGDTWQKPILLVPYSAATSRPFSWAPSLAVDGTTAVAVSFYEVFDGNAFTGFDALARVIKNGTDEGSPIPISDWVLTSIERREPQAALTSRFPAASPQLYRDPGGRIWLDLLETLAPPDAPSKSIVYRRVDMTAAITGGTDNRMLSFNILLFPFIGAVAGWLSWYVLRTGYFGLSAHILVGVTGGFLGGWLFTTLGIALGGSVGPIIASTVGATVQLTLLRRA